MPLPPGVRSSRLHDGSMETVSEVSEGEALPGRDVEVFTTRKKRFSKAQVGYTVILRLY